MGHLVRKQGGRGEVVLTDGQEGFIGGVILEVGKARKILSAEGTGRAVVQGSV